jgi:4-nitrophenyl phosphatase
VNRIAAVILAAGASKRFGQAKQLLDWQGTPMVTHIAEVARCAGLTPVIVVIGCQATEVSDALDSGGLQQVRTVMNWQWEEGLSTSVRVGLSALPPETEAAIFLQCDQPLITADLLEALVARSRETGAAIVYPMHAGQRHSPALIARRFFRELAGVTGDEGGRSVIAAHPDAVASVEIADQDIVTDIDAPADYARLLARSRATSRGRLRARPPKTRAALASERSDPEPPLSSSERALPLRRIRHLIIDMDGVLWHGDTPLPDLVGFFAFLRQRQIDFILATNNSSRLPEQYAAKLARFGVDVSPDHVLTSAQATAAYLGRIGPPGSRVYAIGDIGVRVALEQQGFALRDEEVEYVVVGWDRQLTWDKLATAALLIHAGAKFVGTNPDTNYPTERGPVPGNGAQLATLETTTGVTPIIVGKPEPWMYEEAMRRMGAHPETTAVVGDRLDTDIGGGVRAGLTTVLVLSGIATEADLSTSPIAPDLVCAGIGELAEEWKRQLRQ